MSLLKNEQLRNIYQIIIQKAKYNVQHKKILSILYADN